MISLFYISLFLFSCGFLYWSGEIVVVNLMKLARYLGLTEFVVAFFVMATAASLPNLFVGVNAAIQGFPELSLGDILGNNIIALTLAVALAVLFSPNKEISAKGTTLQTTAVFTLVFAIFPLILLFDGVLSRSDGLILIGLFLFYVFWLFSKKERFTKIYNGDSANSLPTFANLVQAFKSLALIVAGVVGLLLAAQGISSSAIFFSNLFSLPVVFVGLLVVGFGNALPEVYFAIASARRGETSLILGNLMGSVIFPATLVLGFVSLINPIVINGLAFFLASRFFVAIATVLFLVATKTQQKIVSWEAVVLLAVYCSFLGTVLWLV